MVILVTGATGTVGSNVVRELRARGATVRALLRDRERRPLGPHVELAIGDFADPASVRAALEGVDQMFLVCANSPEQVALEVNAIDAAVAAGTRRIVKVSALHAEAGSTLPFWDWHGCIEQHLQAAGLPYVVLRPSFYMTNLLASAATIAETGKLFAPAAEAKVAMIDPRDVAAAAAAVLTEDGHDGPTYELTGPEAITFCQVAEEMSRATGRRVEFVNVADEAALGALLAAGLPDWLATSVVTLFELLRCGVGEQITDSIRLLTGREPRTIADFARDHAALLSGPQHGPSLAKT
jgi:uncharacterized protein YbjT (DUF2867 family)